MKKIFQNSKKKKFLDLIFRNSRKKKFLNRLKYGQDDKPVYTVESLTDAYEIGDYDKAEEIMHEILKRKIKANEERKLNETLRRELKSQ